MSFSGFVTPGNAEWDQVLDRCRHDVYHLPGYVASEAEWYDGRPMAFVWRQGDRCLLIPLIERKTPSGMNRDGMSPYGYSAPVFDAGCTPSDLSTALLAFQEVACERGWAASFIRLHPMLCPSLDDSDVVGTLPWRQIHRGQTVDMPLETDAEQWRSSLKKGLRYDIRRLERENCRMIIDTDAAWQAFPSVYLDTMQRIGASPIYRYPSDYFDGLRHRLDGVLHCTALENEQGDIWCAALFTRVGDLMQYHLSGSDKRFADRAPTKLLLDRVREWAREIGIRRFHLGGGFGGGGDTLFAFKQRFGGQVYPFNTLSAVHDTARYQAECEWWMEGADESLPGPDGFFPPYRAPRKVSG